MTPIAAAAGHHLREPGAGAGVGAAASGVVAATVGIGCWPDRLARRPPLLGVLV